jgi:hypothetical protein
MPFILRVDIDKPYGHHSFIKKVLSKVREDYYFPALNSLGYLKPSIEFLNFCNMVNVPAFLYFRNCTVPNSQVKDLILRGGHIVGFHAEDTRSIETFRSELTLFEEKIGFKVNFFTKHGSGKLKLGRNHYAPYEPEKYKKWGKQLNLDFSFGNGIAKNFNDLGVKDKFYEYMFWMEPEYRDVNFNSIENLIDYAKENIVVLVIHPANFYTHNNVREDLEKLIQLSKTNSIEWLNKIIY